MTATHGPRFAGFADCDDYISALRYTQPPATIGNQVSHKMSAEQKKQAKKSESVQLQIENPLTTSVSAMRGDYTEKKR